MSIRTTLTATLAAIGCAALLVSSVPAAGAAPASTDTRGGQHCVRTLSPGQQSLSVPFGGQSYPVRVFVPADVTVRQSLPLVLDLHGSSANGTVQAGISDLAVVAEREKFLVANPSGAIPLPANPPLAEGSWAWNVPGVPTTAGQFAPPGARDDVAFLAAVVAELDRAACVDERRVFATGFSGGGRMASALACARPDLIAAVAPVAGLRAGRPSPQDTSVPEVQDCTPGRPVPVVTFHGDADLVNPTLGSADLRWGYAVSVAVQTWARINGCRVGPTATPVSAHVTRFAYGHCRQHADVEYYRVAGGGHTWPGTDADLTGLGTVTQEINASNLIWSFFAAHPRRGR
jgi:polyhydroxybutyrate depolymerase